jgi:hypothetical protein
VRGRASNWPENERRRRLAAGFSSAISGPWKQAGITVSPAGHHRLFQTALWPAMQSHADIEEVRPGRRRRPVAEPAQGPALAANPRQFPRPASVVIASHDSKC